MIRSLQVKFFAIMGILFLAVAILPMNAYAINTYTYEGSDFDYFPLPDSYELGDKLSGYFTVEDMLLPNTSYDLLNNPVNGFTFYFHSGNVSISNTDDYDYAGFDVTTNAESLISDYNIYLRRSGPPYLIRTWSDGSLADDGLMAFASSSTGGSWTGPAVVPEPVSSLLFVIGGATLGFRRFRKKFKE